MICLDDRRRHRVRQAKAWNGLDYLEIGQDADGNEDQRELIVFFLDKAPESLENLLPENISIRPCGPGREVKVVGWRVCHLENEERDDCLHITLDRPGGFSPYKLCLIEVDENGRPTGKPLAGLDPRYACLEFGFKVNCPSDLDCKQERICPPEPRVEPEINYLAKDYASFRQLILDRLAVTMPEWKERHVPDLGIALVELLAYVGDHLSYYQDAVGTEAYLDTARRRISVRRHARLVDYPMHEGCNARVWIQVETDADLTLAPDSFYCITGFDPAPPAGKPLTEDDLRNLPGGLYEVFEPVAGDPVRAIALRAAHDEIRFYTWGDRECCLPRGATRATLRDEWKPAEQPEEVYEPPPHYGDACEPPPPPPNPKRRLALRPGSLLLFEEVIGPKTGHPDDADRSHRHVVRLTRVEEGVDELYDPPRPVLEIEWAREDALPFPLCISAIGGEECKLLEPVSVARGNVFLADHGRRIFEPLGSVPAGKSDVHCEGEGRKSEVPQVPGRFHPVLAEAPLTFHQPVPARTRRMAASRLLAQDPRRAVPAVELSLKAPFEPSDWRVRAGLLDSGPDDLHFVAEVDDDGRAHLRFGDGETGEAPLAGAAFWARYRTGNGPAGNIGAETIRHLVLRGVRRHGPRAAGRRAAAGAVHVPRGAAAGHHRRGLRAARRARVPGPGAAGRRRAAVDRQLDRGAGGRGPAEHGGGRRTAAAGDPRGPSPLPADRPRGGGEAGDARAAEGRAARLRAATLPARPRRGRAAGGAGHPGAGGRPARLLPCGQPDVRPGDRPLAAAGRRPGSGRGGERRGAHLRALLRGS